MLASVCSRGSVFAFWPDLRKGLKGDTMVEDPCFANPATCTAQVSPCRPVLLKARTCGKAWKDLAASSSRLNCRLGIRSRQHFWNDAATMELGPSREPSRC